MTFKKNIIAFIMFIAAFSSYGVDTDCIIRNKELAQNMLNQAGQSIGLKASQVTASEKVYESGERYEFTGHIYKASYLIIVKTDSSCFPKEVELVDIASL